MLPSKTVRWAEAGIGNGRQRLMLRATNTRHFSINLSTTHTSRLTRLAPSQKHPSLQNNRSFSLFGWGGSSKASADPVLGSSSTANVDIGPSTTGLDNVRAVKASHATSDAPDPTQAHLRPPNNIEPQFIEDLQEKITLPHGAASERIADIASGATDITAASERMGYLKEVCGLDFGWGPATIMENLLEWLHVTGGLSWTASIIAVAAVLRLAMIKPLIDSQKQGKKMREMQPFIKPLREKYMQLLKEGNRIKAAEISLQMREMNKASGVSYFKAFVPLIIQLPFSFGAFRVLRNAGQLPVPAFVTENWLWTTDLSFSDPYYITPAISALTIYFSFKLQAANQNTMFGPQMMKVLGTALPAMSFIFMSFQPGSVQLYFMTTGIFAYGTTSLLRQQWFRNMTDLGPLPTGPPQITTSLSAQPSQQAQATPRKLPAGIQRIEPTILPAPVPVEQLKQPVPDRSYIDRAVDNVKGQWKDLTQNSSTQGLVGKKIADRQQKQKDAAAARYNAQRQLQLDKDREERNHQAQSRKS